MADEPTELEALRAENKRLAGVALRLERKLARNHELLKQIDQIQWAYERLSKQLTLDLRDRNQAVEEDLAHARALVRALQSRAPALPWLVTAARDEPAATVGGDVHELTVTDGGALRVFVADATGHGIQAALRAMMARTVLARHMAEARGPAELLAGVNDELAAVRWQFETHLAACCFEVRAAPGGMADVRYANAGMPPLMQLGGGSAREVYVPGPFLGMVAGARSVEASFTLRPGDRLVAHSDGLVEQWDPDRAPLPETGLWQRLGAGTTLAEAVDGALAWAEGFRRGAAQADDITVVALELPRA